MPSLRVLMSPLDGTGPPEGTVIPLHGERIVLGRSVACDIVIPNRFVSRRHAQIVRAGETHFLEDTNSCNGTFLNNQALTTRTALNDNDRIRICDLIAAYLVEPAPLLTFEDADLDDDEGAVGFFSEPPRLLTEEEWFASDHPIAMLRFFDDGARRALMGTLPPTDAEPSATPKFLIGPACQRKFRLFVCACARRARDEFGHFENQQYVEAAERHTDSEATARDRAHVHEAVFSYLPRRSLLGSLACRASANIDAAGDATRAVDVLLENEQPDRRQREFAALATLCRDLFRPFRQVTVEPAWLEFEGGVVGRLARAAYEERCLPEGTLDGVRLAVLADALEEAGCTNGDLLEHLRGPGVHVRGCWAVDLLAGNG